MLFRSCLVGRVQPVTTLAEEWKLYVDAVQQIGRRAEALELELVMEVLNRYEAHLLLTAEETVAFVEAVGSPKVGILLDTYHMNIEEKDLRRAIFKARKHLKHFHIADSNRWGVGDGHTDFVSIIRALRNVNYAGPIVVETPAPKLNPLTPREGDDLMKWLETSLD